MNGKSRLARLGSAILLALQIALFALLAAVVYTIVALGNLWRRLRGRRSSGGAP